MTLAMRTVVIAWICGLVACRGHGEPAAETSGSASQRLQVVYDLDLDKAVDDRGWELRRDLEAALADEKIVATVTVSATSPGALTVTPSDVTKRSAIEELLRASYRDTIDRRDCDPSAGPSAICVQIAASYADAIKRAALSSAVGTIRARLVAAKVANPTVVEKAGQIVVEFPAADPQGLAIRARIARVGKLEFKVVDDGSEYMKRLFAHVGSEGRTGAPTDPRAIEDAITAEIDQWRSGDGDAMHADFYLIAHDRDAVLPPERARALGCPPTAVENGQVRCTVSGRAVIERYLAELAATDPSFRIPDDRQIGYERNEPDPTANDRRPFWRTYYLERAVRLTGAAISSAQGSLDPNSNRPLVLLDFNRAGARALGELTEQIVGKKLATIFDDTIKSAPIINGPIRGGRASIAMGGGDLHRQETDRDELVEVLKTGSLPAPLREVSATVTH